MEKNQDFAKRFADFLEWSGKDIGDLCRLIDGDENARAKWYRYRSGAAIPSGTTLMEMKKQFPTLNINWLLCGEGSIGIDSMLNIDEVETLKKENIELRSKNQTYESLMLRAMSGPGKAKGTDAMPEFTDQEGASEMLTDAVFFGVINGGETPMSEWTEVFFGTKGL